MDDKNRRVANRVVNWFLGIQLTIVALVVLWVGIRLFIFDSYIIPSESMEPALLPGDRVIVNKLYHGARIYKNIRELGSKKNPKILNRHGLSPITNGDIVVFNYPYAYGWDSIYMSPTKFFCKRCIAKPGDTIAIRGGLYEVNGELRVGNVEAQSRLPRLIEMFDIEDTVAYPMDGVTPWTIVEFGPMLIPKVGDRITMSRENFSIYRKMIIYETNGDLRWNEEESLCELNGERLNSYTFKENWYFMGGDAVYNSQDSRYFGPIPDPFISGKVSSVALSKDLVNGGYRRERLMMRL